MLKSQKCLNIHDFDKATGVKSNPIDSAEKELALAEFVESLSKIDQYLPHQLRAVKNTNSRYIYCSDNFAKILGYSAGEILCKQGMLLNDQNNGLLAIEDQETLNTQLRNFFTY